MQRHWKTIDALRGLAALAVVLTHTVGDDSFVAIFTRVPWMGLVIDRLFSYGRLGVTLFFIISGFCIHLRWARSVSEGEPARIDFRAFWKRRFTRLYPPYLVAAGIYLIALTWKGIFRWDLFNYYNVLSHIFMVHNFDERVIYAIDRVFWTLAIEEQLYLAYFLLLYLRIRWGWGLTLLICLGGRLAWFGFAYVVNRSSEGFRIPHDGGALAHWFVWALGAISIESALGLIQLTAWASKLRTAFVCFAIAICLDLVSQYHLFGAIGWRTSWLAGAPVWGVGFFVVVNRLVAAEERWRKHDGIPWPVTIFACLGLFSYSTYLTHDLVLQYIGPVLFRSLGITTWLGSMFLLLPLCYGFSWIFFICVERRFIPSPSHQKRPRADETEILTTLPHAAT